MSKDIQIVKLFSIFDALQKKYGDPRLDAIYGAGEVESPDICFVFMNPTGRNISSTKSWKGLKAPWLGTKNIWKFFVSIGRFDKKILKEIKEKRGEEWNYDFAQSVYAEVKKQRLYVTNLSKATQIDARPLPNSDFHEYMEILKKEIDIIKPKTIVTFGNQISSIFLEKPIKVSAERKKRHLYKIFDKEYPVYPVFYPVGQGMRNINKTIEDINWVLKNS